MPRPMADILLDVMKLGFPNGGFFIEAGAHDGVTNSSTSRLPDELWRGLLVEPAPAAFEKLTKSRANQILENCALVGDRELRAISGTFADGSLMGSAHPTLMKRDSAEPRSLFGRIERSVRERLNLSPKIRLLSVRATTLDSLVKKHKVTDIALLVLDVEGFELDVLHGFSFEPRPALVVIETRTPDFSEIAEFMLSMDYLLVANFSNFSPARHPGFSGDHQDYAWIDSKRQDLLTTISKTPLFES